MEMMSQFANEESMWEARAMRFAAALDAVMEDIKDNHIQAITGLPQVDCDRIAEARGDAKFLLKAAKLMIEGK